MKLISPETYWTMYCLHGHVSILNGTQRIHKLIKCNNRYTVNLVIHLSWRKEADVQYLEAPSSTHTAGRLMFQASTPLKGVFTAHFNTLHVFPMVHHSSINIYNTSSCLPNPFPDLSCYPDSHCTSKQVENLLRIVRFYQRVLTPSHQIPPLTSYLDPQGSL